MWRKLWKLNRGREKLILAFLCGVCVCVYKGERKLLKSTKNIYFSTCLAIRVFHVIAFISPFHFTLFFFFFFWQTSIFFDGWKSYITFCHFMHFPFFFHSLLFTLLLLFDEIAFATLPYSFLSEIFIYKEMRRRRKCRKALSLASQKRRIISYSI